MAGRALQLASAMFVRAFPTGNLGSIEIDAPPCNASSTLHSFLALTDTLAFI
jgi:hypothetical protein